MAGRFLQSACIFCWSSSLFAEPHLWINGELSGRDSEVYSSHQQQQQACCFAVQ